MTMQEYLDMVARMRQTGMTPGVPRNYMSPLSSRYPAFQNLGSAWQSAQPKPNLGDISTASNPASTRRRGPGRPRLTAEEIQRTASRLGQGTVGKTVKSVIPMLPTFAKWATPLGIGTEMLRSEPAVASTDTSGTPFEFEQSIFNPQPAPSMNVDDPNTEVIETYPNISTIPSFDVTSEAASAWDAAGGTDTPPSMYPNQIGITDPYAGQATMPTLSVDSWSPNWDEALASTPSGFMPPGAGLTIAPSLSGSVYFGWENPNTPEMRALEQQQAVMDAFNNSGMTIEDFNLTQPSYTMGSVNNFKPGPSTVLGKSYHPGNISAQLAADAAGVVTHLPDHMGITPYPDPADILAAAQVDTFRPVEQLRTDRPRTTTSIFDYLPSFISTASAANTFEDSTYPEYQDYLADEKWHGMGIGNVKTGPGSKDFENWMVSRRTEETPVLPDFNTTMFNDIFTDETALPISWYDDSYQADDFIGKMYRDEEATDNVEKFIDIMVQPNVPAQPTPVVQTRRTTPAPVVTPTITESDEIAMMVRDVVARNAIRDQVRQDLMAGRDRGEPSHAEVQAAINAMMGNEFGGMRGIGFMGADIGVEDGGGYTGGDFSSGAGWE